MCADKSRVIVVVPLYTTQLSADDVVSLERTIAVLGKHPLAVVCPEGLDLSPLDNLLHPGTPAVERFPPTYFKGVEGYNQLMLSTQFYSRFAGYEYLLICQTDAFVFEDKLEILVREGLRLHWRPLDRLLAQCLQQADVQAYQPGPAAQTQRGSAVPGGQRRILVTQGRDDAAYRRRTAH